MDPAETTAIVAALRRLQDDLGQPLARRAALMRLADALEFLAATLALPAQGGPGAHPAQAAQRECSRAWQALQDTLPPPLQERVAAWLAAAARAAAVLAGHGRGAEPARRSPPPSAAPPMPSPPPQFAYLATAPVFELPEAAADRAPPEPAAPETAVPMDDARFGASAPAVVPPGREFIAEFVAYPAGAQEQARALLSRPHATLEVGAATPLQRGTRLDVEVRGSGFMPADGESARQSFVWQGTPVKLAWALQAADGAHGESLLRLDVAIDGIVVARVRLPIEVAAAAPAAPPPVQAEEAAIARRAFASYASADRLRVLDRVASIRLAAGIRVFLDCHDLHPGKAWQPQLEREIDASELFLLFWSAAAAKSGWVRWEYERAIERLGEQCLQIHPLDNGVAPPRALAHLHLGDPMMDLRQAEAQRRGSSPS
ncbi:toll/interleukin-1 receptor domain-containing protein [Rubrivivax sp. JA1026]|uniref:toll/interleukin-1 receptor domain-containing protein n=1 Tax=Rubrivivax sp. JA1026 TaxID=2710888 RepID=UPI0013E98AD9|nr:toll/interleukin-1 receptor domain-containing protein [Rubrivivax sp. JA1026]